MYVSTQAGIVRLNKFGVKQMDYVQNNKSQMVHLKANSVAFASTAGVYLFQDNYKINENVVLATEYEII